MTAIVQDFLDRHEDEIAEAIVPKPLVHTCMYPPGRRVWRFSWRFPFVRTWISKAICLCEINAIMARKQAVPERHTRYVFVGDMTPEDALSTCINYHAFLHKHYATPNPHLRDASHQPIGLWRD